MLGGIAGSPPDTRDELIVRLRAAGLRVTGPRVAVLEVVGQRPHVTAAAAKLGVCERIGSVSTQAVYDILQAFTVAGLVRRIQPPGSADRYETRTGDNHHHSICRSCGALADVDCAKGSAPCLTAAGAPGFVVDEAELVFWGLCASCRSPSNPKDTR